MKDELAFTVIKTAPPIAVVSAQFLGLTLDEWLTVLTLLYVVAQIVCLVYDRIQRRKSHSLRRKEGK